MKMNFVLILACVVCLAHSTWINGVELEQISGMLYPTLAADKSLNLLKRVSNTALSISAFDGSNLHSIPLAQAYTSVGLSYDSSLLIVSYEVSTVLQLWYATRNSNLEDFGDFIQLTELSSSAYTISSSKITISKDKSVISYTCSDNIVRWAQLTKNMDETYSATLVTPTSTHTSTLSESPSYLSENGRFLGYANGNQLSYVRRDGEEIYTLSLSSVENFAMTTQESGLPLVAAIVGENLVIYQVDTTSAPTSSSFVLSYDYSASTAADKPADITFTNSAVVHLSEDGTIITLVDQVLFYIGVISFDQSNNMVVNWAPEYSSSNHQFWKITDGLGAYYIIPQIRAQAQIVDCTGDQGSTGRSLRNGQCQCLLGYYWDQTDLICKPTCNTKFATGVSDSDPLVCDCKAGTVWDALSRVCVIDCENIQDATGQWLSQEVCECNSQSVWNSSTLTCRFDCRLVSGSTGQEVSPGVCECPIKTKWDADTTSCVPDCAAIPHSSEDTDGSCVCDTGFEMIDGECRTTDCGAIQFSDGQPAVNGDCACNSGFDWVREFGECVIDCSTGGDLSTGENAGIHECQCVSTALWNTNTRNCDLNCELFDQATGNSDDVSCTCNTGFTWVAANTACLPECLAANGEDGTRNELGFCNCLPGFTINPFENKCYRQCSSIQNAKVGFGPTPTSCYCSSGFTWGTSSCDLACSGPFDTGAIENINNVNQCVCETNTFYSSTLHTCQLKCTLDTLAKGYDPVNQQCICKTYAAWVEASNSCECTAGYQEDTVNKVCSSASGGAAAAIALSSVLLSGLTVFGGMKIYEKRRKAKAQEEQVQIDENISQSKPSNSESAKNFETEKIE